ncbi:hypothetical protein KR038_005385, partial [Drosophila bunnanda]
ILNFMKKNPDLAKGFVKGDRVASDAKWSDLTNALNAIGPPIKDVGGWKKVWCDWRSAIRKKIAKNMAGVRATGRSPYSQQVVTEVEEGLAKVCGLYEVVDEVDAPAYGVPSTVVLKPDLDNKGEIEEPEEESFLLEADEEPRPKRRRVNPVDPAGLDFQGLCKAQLNIMTQLSSSMTEHFKKMEELQKEDISIKKELLS